MRVHQIGRHRSRKPPEPLSPRKMRRASERAELALAIRTITEHSALRWMDIARHLGTGLRATKALAGLDAAAIKRRAPTPLDLERIAVLVTTDLRTRLDAVTDTVLRLRTHREHESPPRLDDTGQLDQYGWPTPWTPPRRKTGRGRKSSAEADP